MAAGEKGQGPGRGRKPRVNPGCLVGASGCPEVLLPAAGSTHPELKVGLETQAWKMDAEALQRGFRRLLPEKPEQEGLQGRVAEGGPLPSSSLSGASRAPHPPPRVGPCGWSHLLGQRSPVSANG